MWVKTTAEDRERGDSSDVRWKTLLPTVDRRRVCRTSRVV